MIVKSPILITGCSRSGSSMIAATVNLCGAFGGKMFYENQSAKRGMYENVKIRDSVVKAYLREVGADDMGQYPIVDSNNLPLPVDWKQQLRKILMEDGYSGGNWMYKDSRSALIWPIWHSIYPKAKWIIVRRRTGDVVDSCIKTGFMSAFKNEDNQKNVGVKNEREGWIWWVHEYEKRFVEMITIGLDYRIIWPERMVDGDYNQLYELCDWLELTWKKEALSFIDTLLWNSRIKKGGQDGSKSNS